MGIYLALGANQDAVFDGHTLPPARSLREACAVLDGAGIHVVKASHLWQSPAWPDPGAQPAYLNAVVAVETESGPEDLLAKLNRIEALFGRRRSVRNAPRPLDIDILDYEGRMIDSPRLSLPHPRMLSRAFVLLPLAEIAPEWRDPIKKRAITDWIARLPFGDVAPLRRLGALI